jgi:hypothetical protein
MFILNNFGRRKLEALRDVLSAYTDALVGSDERASDVLKQHPDEVSALEDLFDVSYQLHEMLVPVKTRSRFVSDLKTELQNSQKSLVMSRQERRRRQATQLVNTIGIILSIMAVTALLARLIGAIIIIMKLRSRRRRSVATV